MSNNWRSHFIDFKEHVWNMSGYVPSMLVGNMVACLRKQGWELVCKADVSAKVIEDEDDNEYKADVDTWYFIKIDK